MSTFITALKSIKICYYYLLGKYILYLEIIKSDLNQALILIKSVERCFKNV